MYGQDADLIVLSLVTHEPNFAIIREVTFDRRKIVTDPDDQKFHLTHISLLREYLELDFNCLKDKLPFKFDLERIIDDFVLLTFFVGNDFLPHLPGLDIAEGSLNLIFQFYKELLPTMPDYLTFGGKVNWDSLQILFKKLAQHERSLFDIFPVQFEHIENQFNDEKPKPENENGDHSIEITTSQKPQLADVLFGNKRDEVRVYSLCHFQMNLDNFIFCILE
jgi:5'-3' exonuclease